MAHKFGESGLQNKFVLRASLWVLTLDTLSSRKGNISLVSNDRKETSRIDISRVSTHRCAAEVELRKRVSKNQDGIYHTIP